DYQAANFFSFMAWLLGITALGIGGLITEPATEENTSSSLYHKLLPCTLALIPALHFAQVNPEYLKGIYPLAYIFFIVTFATLNKFLLKAFSGTRLSSRRLSLNASVFTFSILFLPLLRAVMKVRNDGDFDFWILCLVLLLVSGLVRTKKAFQRLFQIVLITLLVFFLAYLGSFLKGYRQSNRKIKVIPSELQNLSFTTSPNIYIFVYDGIPNQRVFKAQNLPFSDLEGILRHYAFKLYEDTYTLGEMSMDSMGNMLDFTDQLRAKAGKASSQAQDTYTGNSITNLLLRSIGYRSHFLLDNYYTGMHSVLNRDLATEIYPIRELSEVGFHFLKVLLSGIFQGEMALETKDIITSEGYMGFAIQNRKLALIKEANDKTLVVNHFFLPGHSQNTGFCRPNETQLWIERLAEALIQMEKDFSAIQAHDPNAIVIAIGDHGPSLTGDCFRLAAWKKEDITPDLIWDRIGTMVAIRWPDPQKAERFDAQLVTNQDIIPILLAYLSESNLPLKYCPGDVFYGFKTPLRSAIGFDKGTILR
ncbi:MAG: hypothetical protein PHI68_07115, partial [Candidatus Cloacimonetes bacterium]|nr:hypothetical protein [Candidatus Cloacimonadota bacterium]